MKFISIVEDKFQIENRGCVVVPGIPVRTLDSSYLKVGDFILLELPDGKIIKTIISGFEMLCRTQERPPTPILLPDMFKKEDIPIGTKIFVEDDKIG